MNRYCFHFISIALVLLKPVYSVGQEKSLDAHFSVTTALGGGWSGVKRWTFQSCDCALVKPGIGVGLGLEYGPVLQLEGALLIPSIEISFAEESASRSFPTGSIEGGRQRMPIMVWAKIISNQRLSPFLRVGAGIEKTDYRESSLARWGPTIRFHQWQFSWGLGGGLNYQVGSAIALELFVDDWVTEEDILAVNSFGDTDGIFGRSGMYIFGARAVIAL